MITLGIFAPMDGGAWTGRLRTTTANFLATIMPDGGRRFLLKRGNSVLGRGGLITSKAGKKVIRIEIDDPAWPRSIHVALMLPESGTRVAQLIWKRVKAKS